MRCSSVTIRKRKKKEMKTHSKKAKKYSYAKDCKEQPRKSLVTRFHRRVVAKDPERNVVRFLKKPATRFPRNRVVEFPGNPAAKFPRKPVAKKVVKKAKKQNYTKDCKEQHEEIPDQCKKKSLKPVCVAQDRFACTYEPEETCRDKKKQHCHKVEKIMGILKFLNNGYNPHQKNDCYILEVTQYPTTSCPPTLRSQWLMPRG